MAKKIRWNFFLSNNANFKICYFIYNIERSVCDIMRLEARDIEEILSEVYKNEYQKKRLLKYTELLRVKQIH